MLALRLVRNHATAEDLVQQAFVNIFRLGKSSGSVDSAYAARAVRNLALNHLRDMRRRGYFHVSDAEFERIADPRPSPEMAAIYRSELRRLLEAVAGLPHRRREAFLACKIEGLSYDEVAVRFGVSRNTVISHVAAAMVDLDRRLQRA